jgi:hypothetical protein
MIHRLPGCAATLLTGLSLALSPIAASADSAAPFDVEVTSRPIRAFQIGSEESKFGPLEFVGGLEMTANSRHFGAHSGFRFTKPGSDLIGVADTGFWFFGRIDRDPAGRPSGVSGFAMTQMVDERGETISRKWEVDAEGLDVEGDTATVGFERNHRVAQFEIDRDGMGAPLRTLNFIVPKNELRQNRGFETVTRAPRSEAGKGPLVVVSEKSLDDHGNIFAAIIDGPGKGIFTVARKGEFDITDGAFLPNGDLLILERSFSMATGIRMRLRRLDEAGIRKGAVADGPFLMQADMGYQIDNMEAMDVWTREDGAVMVSLMSDDNHSILQRNIYLEFILHED